ncbi:EpsG family protein [bacterium]|nr:MAG: EpsG family protein [bacterium]
MLIYILFFLIIFLLSFGIRYSDKVSSKLIEFFLFFFIALFAGLRNHVGTDYNAYEEIFKDISRYGDTSYSVEPGFHFLNSIVTYLNGGFIWLNIISAFISSFFMFKAINFFVENQEEKWLSYIVFISIGVFFVYFFSGIRQGISISIFLFSIKYIINRRLLYYIGFIFIGSLFHSSIFFFLPLYWLPRFSINKTLVTSLVFSALILAYVGVTSFLFQYVISLFTGGHYMGYQELFSGAANTKTGVGVLLRIILGLFLILISNYWVKTLKHIIIYNLFSIGLILYSFFLGVDILNRISEYLMDTLIFVLPVSLTSFTPVSRIVYVFAIIILLIALYYSNINFKEMNLIPYKI